MTTALDNQKQAISLFQQNNGSESLYLQCQRFDGFYTQSAAVGHWNSATYASAKIAYQVARAAGRVYTTDLNDSRIEGLERVYYDWGQYGHVCAIVGRTADGRLVVTNTANAGDDLGQLGNHVKLSHADSLGLPLLGISSRDGNNPHLSGFDMVQFGGAAPTPQPAGQDDWINLNGWYWFNSADEAMWLRNPQRPLIYGDRDVLEIAANGSIKIAANDGTQVWISGQARPRIFYKGGSGGSAGKYYFDVPAGGQYYYNKYENALNGNYDASQIMYGGSREVVENPGTGPVRVEAKDGSLVWVGTRRNPAAIRRA